MFKFCFALSCFCVVSASYGLVNPPPSVSLQASGTMEVGFSPEGSGLALVLKFIDVQTASNPISVMAYSLTSPDVVRALIAKKKRGVPVRVLIDKK